MTHDSAAYLGQQLGCEALLAGFERLIVVDNASTDGSAEIARRAGADVVARGRNDSLAAAINEGVRHSTSPVFAILNPDIELDRADAVQALEASFGDPSVGLVAPALRLPHGALQDSARTVPSPLQLVRRRLTRRAAGAIRAVRVTDVDWVVGAFLVVRRKAFDDVGGFDPRYRLYFEDVDFCVRMWSHGWRVRLNPHVVARHEHQAASRRVIMGWATRQHIRSAAIFYRSHPDLTLSAGRRRLVRAAR